MTHRSETAIDPRFSDRECSPGFDLLRALAIIVVVIYHAALFGFKLPGRVDRFGWIGVDLFFVLSGYLIGGQLLAPLAREQSIKLGRFFARRVFRIMPAYFVILAVYFLLPSWREYPDMAQALWKFLFSVPNIALHGGGPRFPPLVLPGGEPILFFFAVLPPPFELRARAPASYSI